MSLLQRAGLPQVLLITSSLMATSVEIGVLKVPEQFTLRTRGAPLSEGHGSS
jgi:hypothetical protein